MSTLEIRKKVKYFYEEFARDFSATRTRPWKEVVQYYPLIKGLRVVCDLGCGNGRYSEDLLKICDLVLGLDISFSLLKIAKNKLKNENFEAINGDACYLPFRDTIISSVVSIATIHHIPSRSLRRKCVLEIHRVLENGGIIIVTSWSLTKPRNLIASILNFLTNLIHGKRIEIGDAYIRWGKSYYRYFHFFTLREMIELFKEFKLLYASRFGKGIIKENNLIVAAKI